VIWTWRQEHASPSEALQSCRRPEARWRRPPVFCRPFLSLPDDCHSAWSLRAPARTSDRTPAHRHVTSHHTGWVKNGTCFYTPLTLSNSNRFLRAKAECFARLCHRLGVRPSVCPSVTFVICIKMVQARTTKSSPWTAPRSLVYRDKISCHWVQGFPSNEGVKEGYPP